jgi:hypothetical protein
VQWRKGYASLVRLKLTDKSTQYDRNPMKNQQEGLATPRSSCET